MLSTVADIKTAYAEALKLQNEGQTKAALEKYVQIDLARPNIPEVHFQVARLFLRSELPQRALPFAQSAAQAKPGEPEIWKVYAEAIRTLSDRTAQREFAKLLSRAPIEKRLKGNLSTGTALNGKDITPIGDVPIDALSSVTDAISKGAYAEAEALADAALKSFSSSSPLHSFRSIALSEQDRFEEAIAASEKAIRLAPTYAGAWANYARVLHKAGKGPEGVGKANAALKLAPGYSVALIARADCLFDMKRPQEGLADLRRALEVDPKNTQAAYKLATQLLAERELFEARDIILKAKKSGKFSDRMDLLLASVLSELNETEDALEILQGLDQRSPDNATVKMKMATLVQTHGRFDEAEATFKEALRLDPNRGDAYRIYLVSKKLGLDDPMIPFMQERFEDETLSEESRAGFGFALGKVMEDNKQYDQVFRYLHPANAMMRKALGADGMAQSEESYEFMASMRSVNWSDVPMNDACDAAPIFVTGMPRSGTTLVEQIIAAHSTVTNGGEISVSVERCKRMLTSKYDRILPVSAVPQSEFEALGEWYQEYTNGLFPGHTRLTDKSIATYTCVGVLKRAMPKARFVIVRRDPRDNLLSMYKNVFPNGGHAYSYSLSDLADTYKRFVAFVDLWRELTPDWFYEIQYEDLIANPEEESRKLIDAVGLDWEDACLDFHRSDSRVKTLSLYQVRQPIYKSSSKAWERYGDDLNELFEALGPEYLDAAE